MTRYMRSNTYHSFVGRKLYYQVQIFFFLNDLTLKNTAFSECIFKTQLSIFILRNQFASSQNRNTCGGKISDNKRITKPVDQHRARFNE